MLASSIPAKIQLPFANNAGANYIRALPVASQIGITNGEASYTDGFPPLCFIPQGSGGYPPDGRDMNAVLNAATAWARWYAAGGPIVYDATFATSIGGYPAGALLQKANGSGLWRSTVDNNTSNPDTGGANWTTFIPAGSLASSSLLTVSTTLTAAQTGGAILLGGTTSGQSATLPLVSAMPNSGLTAGNGYWFSNVATVAWNVIAQTGDSIRRLGSAFVLQPGESLFVYTDGTAHTWDYFGVCNAVFPLGWPISITGNAASATTATTAGSAISANNATNATNATNAANVLGNGQNYAVGGRVIGTVYTNNYQLNKPIHVQVSFATSGGTSSTVNLLINGGTLAQAIAVSGGSQGYLSFIVPYGSTYQLSLVAGVAANLIFWSELR